MKGLDPLILTCNNSATDNIKFTPVPQLNLLDIETSEFFGVDVSITINRAKLEQLHEYLGELLKE